MSQLHQADAHKDTPFYQRVVGSGGHESDVAIANSCCRTLERWGVSPAELVPVTAPGNNTMLFAARGLAFKLVTEIENHQQMPLDNPLILAPLRRANVGFDMGDAAISLEVYPFLNTKDVEPRHVQALCHELATKHGLVFRDNKLDNVGLSADGVPYVLDPGSVVPLASLHQVDSGYVYDEGAPYNPLGSVPAAPQFVAKNNIPQFYHPELSGFNQGQWSAEAVGHGFSWPGNQQDVPQFANALLQLAQPQPPGARVTKPTIGLAGV